VGDIKSEWSFASRRSAEQWKHGCAPKLFAHLSMRKGKGTKLTQKGLSMKPEVPKPINPFPRVRKVVAVALEPVEDDEEMTNDDEDSEDEDRSDSGGERSD
jgi:hypothetical protein